MRRLIAPTLAVLAMLAGLLVAPAASAAESTDVTSTVEIEAALEAETAIGDAIQTADLSQFQAGNIISDAVFYDTSTMTESQIQSFLETRVPSCRSGYTCLKDWYDTSRSMAADSVCKAYSGGVRERASRIIYKVAQACGINPQVLLVMLQKEQSLVNHDWPSEWRFDMAMGATCSDTYGCEEDSYGFFNQMYKGAWDLKRYSNPPGTSQYFTWYAPGKTWNILWNPERSCGSSPVYVQNQATANLYYYTPYQPNAAAIKAGYGTGDGCSSYGNRNFYQYFTDWFGSTTTPVNACAQPSSPRTAVKTYVVTASSLNARSAPSLACDKNISALAQGTVLQATAVVDGWLRVDTESGARWVAREHLRYATADESACALPAKTGSAQYAYVLVAQATGRAVPSSGCASDATEIAAGTIVQAFAVSADKDWVKVDYYDRSYWIDRSNLRRASDTETACAAPGGTSPAKLFYVVRDAGTSARTAPEATCGIGRASISGGVVVQALEANTARDWLKVSTGRGEMWIDRDHLTNIASSAVCSVTPGTRDAQMTYLVTSDSAASYSAATRACASDAEPMSIGTVLRPHSSTDKGDWLVVTTEFGDRWVPRDAVQKVTAEELCQQASLGTRPAKLTYAVIQESSTFTAPYAECSDGAQLAVGAVAKAIEVTDDGAWLKLALPDGDRWIDRSTVRYATSQESCAAPEDTRAARLTYTVKSATTGRIAPYDECGLDTIDVAAGTVATASQVTADGSWLKMKLAEGEYWVARSDVDYATAADRCIEPADSRTAKLTYVLTSGVAGRVAPYDHCSAGSVDLAADTIATAVKVSADRQWLKLSVSEGDFWVPRSSVRYATNLESCVEPTNTSSARLTYVVTTDTIARSAPYTECTLGSMTLVAGTVAVAVEVNEARDWLKLRLPGGEYWVVRSDTERLTGG
ncbi:SH3 domain-containing protein [Microbacterium xanthum]|uniref:SH3 domain-containing protein n=1 Tax=Microbacterium xanthum TaxID=3079794 RepID=UPI002AD5A8BA|nr:SH3 domain-containing protein [Microbacterium sp. KSW-48]MDZ8171041.1 SH3 domain-containing protein [Microbacterium sp. KSW-48]